MRIIYRKSNLHERYSKIALSIRVWNVISSCDCFWFKHSSPLDSMDESNTTQTGIVNFIAKHFTVVIIGYLTAAKLEGHALSPKRIVSRDHQLRPRAQHSRHPRRRAWQPVRNKAGVHRLPLPLSALHSAHPLDSRYRSDPHLSVGSMPLAVPWWLTTPSTV